MGINGYDTYCPGILSFGFGASNNLNNQLRMQQFTSNNMFRESVEIVGISIVKAK